MYKAGKVVKSYHITKKRGGCQTLSLVVTFLWLPSDGRCPT